MMRVASILFLLLLSNTGQRVHGTQENHEEDLTTSHNIRGGGVLSATTTTAQGNQGEMTHSHNHQDIIDERQQNHGSSNLETTVSEDSVSPTRRQPVNHNIVKKTKMDIFTPPLDGITPILLKSQHEANVARRLNVGSEADRKKQIKRKLALSDGGEDQIKRKLQLSGGTDQASHCTRGSQYIVTCKGGWESNCLYNLYVAGIPIVHMLPTTDYFAVCVDNDIELESLRGLADIDDIELDPLRSLKHLPESERMSHRHLQDEAIPYGLNLVKAPEFWSLYNKKGNGIKVCVVDTGLLGTHEDLKDADFDGSASTELVTPFNLDGHGHGTHVAGTVGAVENGKGVVGVAPEVSIYVARVFNDQAQFSASSLMAAMNECAMVGSNIISMSLGGSGSSNAERGVVDDLTAQGILIIAAAGNSGNKDNPIEYPASYDNVMSVAAVDSQERLADFSSFNDQISVAAPGVSVESTYGTSNGSYRFLSGTSMATPHVSGVAALLMSQFPGKSGTEIREAIESSAVDMGACGYDNMFGHGMVDTVAAAARLEGGNAASDITNCIETTVSVLTDDFGSETTWVISKKEEAGASADFIVHKGGPYADNERATYIDTIDLPKGCYEFKIEDSYKDGSCCKDSFGTGEYSVQYNNKQVVFNKNFQGGEMKFEFGCEDDTDSGAEENNDPVCGNEVVEEGEECDDGNSDNNDSCTNSCRNAKCGDAIKWTNMEECDDGNTNNNDSCTNDCKNASCGDGYVQSGEDCDDGNSDNNDSCTNQCLFPTTCGSGLNQVSVELETDLYGNSESQVYMFDRDRTAPAGSGDDYKWPDSDYAWVYRTGDLEKETTYDWTVCLEPSKCFVFYFFDDMGDGIEAGFLDLKVNDNRVLYVVPDSDSFELWMPDTSKAIYWYEEIGNC